MITPPRLRHLGSLACLALAAPCLLPSMLPAAPLTIRITVPAPADPTGFTMGTATRPEGATITIDSRSLLLDGRPWMPVMGEFHYSRYPETEWREELLKMKAGGIDIVATYVFWNHHEEIEGQWDWSGQRDLRRFIEACRDTGLLATVRCGPWCHGEVRNGGIPDWALTKSWKVRTDDAGYLDHVRLIYGQIAEQLRGLLWKDGGPVIAVQVENEYRGPAEHLLNLKRIARDAGLDVPLYTRTGWPLLQTPMPFGEIAPLFGAYAEGFWDRELTSMPGKYWAAFHFQSVRTDAAIATEQLGERAAQDEADSHRYPYLTCELGGGMMNSYHRRIAIDPVDVEAVALVKIGSGGNLPGYYMYHGGTNPAGRLTTLMEAQDTPMTNWNDMPVKSYDFQAPLGEYGQVRPHYHSLRRLHLFARDFGGTLATMPATLPDTLPRDRDDTGTLRWAVRSDGSGGFVFVNNHQRGVAMPAHDGVQFSITTDDGEIVFPDRPVAIAPGALILWPFNLDLGHGVTLRHATAQVVCAIDDDNVRTIFLAASPGVPVELSARVGDQVRTSDEITPSRDLAMVLEGDGGRVQLVVLDEADSLTLWKGTWRGRERVVLSTAEVVFDEASMRLTSDSIHALTARVFPPLNTADDGVFQKILPPRPPALALTAEVEAIRPAGAARDIPLGRIATPVAVAPGDADFAAAAVWSIRLPRDVDLSSDIILRLDYRGDVVRVLIGDRFITDDFYNGRPLEIGLRRHASELARTGGQLRVAILPLRRDAPIFLPAEAWPQLPGEPPIAELRNATLIPRYSVELPARP